MNGITEIASIEKEKRNVTIKDQNKMYSGTNLARGNCLLNLDDFR